MRELLVVNLCNGQQQAFEGSMIHGDLMAIHGQFLLSKPEDILISEQELIESVFQLRCEHGQAVYIFDDKQEILLGQIDGIEIHSN